MYIYTQYNRKPTEHDIEQVVVRDTGKVTQTISGILSK